MWHKKLNAKIHNIASRVLAWQTRTYHSIKVFCIGLRKSPFKTLKSTVSAIFKIPKRTLPKKRWLLGVFIFIFSIFYPVHRAYAVADWLLAGIGGVISGFVAAGTSLGVMIGVVVLFLGFSTVLLDYANILLGWATSSPFGVSMTNPNGNIVIELGWTLTRDFTNMLFILGLAYIGLATALDIGNKFNTKKTFINLLLIALLINFTPIICGAIIDISNIITNFFLSNVDFSAMLEAVQNNFGFVKVVEGTWANLGSFFAMTGIALVFSLVSGIILLSFSIIFILRHIMIWTLVILSPLAFFSWIFEKTRKHFTHWWKSFFSWSFIAVPLGLFIYLANHLTQQISKGEIVKYSITDSSRGLLAALLPHFMVTAFLIVGFVISMKTMPKVAKTLVGFVGGSVLGAAIGAAGSAVGLSKFYTKSAAKKTASKIYSGKVGDKIREKERAGFQKVGSGVAELIRHPGKTVGGALTRGISGLRQAPGKALETAKKVKSKISVENLKELGSSFGGALKGAGKGVGGAFRRDGLLHEQWRKTRESAASFVERATMTDDQLRIEVGEEMFGKIKKRREKMRNAVKHVIAPLWKVKTGTKKGKPVYTRGLLQASWAGAKKRPFKGKALWGQFKGEVWPKKKDIETIIKEIVADETGPQENDTGGGGAGPAPPAP